MLAWHTEARQGRDYSSPWPGGLRRARLLPGPPRAGRNRIAATISTATGRPLNAGESAKWIFPQSTEAGHGYCPFPYTVFQTPPRAWTSSSKGPSIPMKITANRHAFTLLSSGPGLAPYSSIACDSSITFVVARQRGGSATHNVRAVQTLRRLADGCFKFRKA